MQQLPVREGRPPSQLAPFGLDLSLNMIDRATRLARSLFTAADASIILVYEGQVWRSRHEDLPTTDPISEAVMASGELFWVEDGRSDLRVADNPLVTGPPFLRFCAAMPICLRDGSRPGVLSVSGLEPQPYDIHKAARLRDLADIVADEWTRAQEARAHAQSLRERDAAFERNERSEERLNMALALADLHVWELDYGRRELIKAGAEDTFFSETQTYENLYRDIFVTIDPRDRPAVAAAWKDHVENGAPYRPEYRISRPDGVEVWAQGVVKLFTDERGRATRLIGALQNITARKLVEQALLQAKAEAETANQTKSDFLATMSHEIRTPLNGVLGMAQAMAADDLAPKQRQRLEVVRQSGQMLLGILNDILDISKIEAGKIEIEAVEFDLRDIAAHAHAAFAGMSNEKGLSFVLEITAPPGLYRGDPTRVRQILNNLLANALKFTQAGEIRVAIGHARGLLTIVVSDTGVGMTSDALSSVFDKFTQADSSTTRQFGGTGLGLTICRELAQLMGGSIKAASKPERGSTFTVSLPLPWIAEGPSPAAIQGNVGPSAAREMGEIRILAAEDNAVNQLVLKTLLLQAGLEVVTVDNGAQAVAAWQEQSWDVILMDVQMPVMDGPTAVRTIRGLEDAAGRPRTPIIGLTANAMSHQLAEYHAAGMDRVVSKPIEVEKLFAALRSALDSGEAALATSG